MKIGRNQPCPCGSGKKYKKCCLPKDEEAEVLEADLEPQEEEFPLLAEPGTPIPRIEVQTPCFSSHAPRSTERTMADMGRHLRSQDFTTIEEANNYVSAFLAHNEGRVPAGQTSTSLEQAQDLAYDAWEAGGKRGIKLARRALELSPDCADAYHYLAQHEPFEEKRLELLRQAVAAGERALNPDKLKKPEGGLWTDVLNRPYLRARAALADALWETGRRDEAVSHWKELLRLTPGDNQGIRYRLLAAFLERDDRKELDDLLRRYEEDNMAVWAYGRAIHLFRKEGDSPAAKEARRTARRDNPLVMKYLLGKAPLPDEVPEYVEPGSDDEAAACALALGRIFEKIPGAVDWLAR